MRRLLLMAALLTAAPAAAGPERAGAALGILRRPAILALRDPDWAARRALALAALRPPSAGSIPPAWPLSAAYPEGPLYRLPLYGRLERDGADGALSIRAAPGAAAFAPAAGRIAYAGRFRGYGEVLILDHGHGWTTVIAGLADLAVVQGAAVRGGDAIGRAGPMLRVQLLHHGRGRDVRAIAARLGG